MEKLTKEKAISILAAFDYKNTATGSNENILFFLKKIDNKLSIHATVDLKHQTVYLDVLGMLDMGISLRTLQMAIDTPQFFDNSENALINYVHILNLDEPIKAEVEISTKIKKTFDERKSELWDMIRQVGKEKGYAKEMCQEFYAYWTEKNPEGKKFRFEMEKIFDVKRRLNTWLLHDKKWSKTFVDKKVETQNKELKETGKNITKKSDLF